MKKTLTVIVLYAVALRCHAWTIDEGIKAHLPSAIDTQILQSIPVKHHDGSTLHLIKHKTITITVIKEKDGNIISAGDPLATKKTLINEQQKYKKEIKKALN